MGKLLTMVTTVKQTRKNKSKGAPRKSSAQTAGALVANVNDRDFDQNAIRCYAYSLFEQRGREHGHDLDDWLRAERELLSHSGNKVR